MCSVKPHVHLTHNQNSCGLQPNIRLQKLSDILTIFTVTSRRGHQTYAAGSVSVFGYSIDCRAIALHSHIICPLTITAPSSHGDIAYRHSGQADFHTVTYFATYGMHMEYLTENFAFSTFQYYANVLNEFHVV